MATSLKNLSDINPATSIDLSQKKIAVIVSEYNPQVTEALYEGVVQTLTEQGANLSNILKKYVPGAYELSLGAQYMAQMPAIDAVICLGCVIQGETKHFDFICNAVAHGITEVSLKYNKPVIFGVLTPNTQQQALDRAGGIHGNKGVEAAAAAIKMLAEFVG
jgi:6,7-dimethyl-8-ribityllumazine synthase